MNEINKLADGEAVGLTDRLERPKPLSRKDFRHFATMQTRWMDNDAVL